MCCLELIREWRMSLREALDSLTDWVAYYKRTVPNVNVPPLPSINTGK